jgi:monofunctional glycosyltransferase
MRTFFRALSAVVLACVTMFMLAQIYFFGWVCWYANHPPQRTAFMAHRLGELHESKPDASIRYQWVEYAKISRHLKRAMIAAEDSKFVEHEGFDWEGASSRAGQQLRSSSRKICFFRPIKVIYAKGKKRSSL